MNDIIEKIEKCNNIVLLCHKNPDGDAIGSSLALYYAFKILGKNVDIVIGDAPKRFSYLKGYSEILSYSDVKYDTAVIVDTATIERVNDISDILVNVNKKYVIDHHISNTNYGDVNCVFKYPACCELVYYIIKQLGVPINSDIAEALSTGLLTDTGGFSHSDVLPSTFAMASELSEIVNMYDIYKKALNSITMNQFEIKKIALNNLEFYSDGQIAYSFITKSDMEKTGVDENDCSILVNIPMEVDKVEVSILIRKYDEQCRVSLRSVNVDVNEILKKFGGGGHKNAAGAILAMPYYELKEEILKEVGIRVNEWNSTNK